MSKGEATKTIADARASGETALTVHCLAQGCYHQAAKTFEELWNDMIFVDVPQYRRLVCTKCGSRKVSIRSVWPKRENSGPFYSRSISS